MHLRRLKDYEDYEVMRWVSRFYLLAIAISAFIGILVIQRLRPGAIPFSTFEFWKPRGSLLEALRVSWPIFAWGVGVNALYSVLTRNDPEHNRNAERILSREAFASAFAGIVEEIDYRWLLFFIAIVGAKLTNWLFFGWAGFGINEWLYTHIAGRLANLITFGKIEHILFHKFGWAVGAGLLTANAKFRDGHKYQGSIGLVNSWFIGFFFFWLMFEYGLVACIVVHFLYDLFIDLVRYIDMVVERALGWI